MNLRSNLKNYKKLSGVPGQGPLHLYDEKTKEFVKILDAGEYIVGIRNFNRNAFVFRYNVHTDEWTLIMQLPDCLVDEYGGRCPLFFIEKDTKMLIICSHRTELTMVDLEKQSVIYRAPPGDGFSSYEAIVKVDENFHRIDSFPGGWDFHHDVWNTASLNWEQNKDIKDLAGLQLWIDETFEFEDAWATAVLHVPSQNILLLFCQSTVGVEYDNIGVWRYHITKAQWTRINGIDFESGYGVVLTACRRTIRRDCGRRRAASEWA